MAWNTHLYHEWYSDDGTLLRINFKRNWATGSVVEMDGQPDPFVLIGPDMDRFEVVRGAGATLNLMTDTNMHYSNPGFIGDDPKEWLVEYLEDSNKKWFGYLERRTFAESYTESENYPLTLYANDGFNLLDRIQFLDGNGEHYSGFMTQLEVIHLVLQKWGLLDQVLFILIGLSTYSRQIWYLNGGYNNILEGTYVNMQNYYDEDGRAMTCREVLESILRPYSANIHRSGTSILIYDINGLAGGGDDKGTGRDQFGWTTVYDNDFVIWGGGGQAPAWQDIYDDLGIYQTGGTYSQSPNYKGVTVRYSPYKAPALLSNLDNHTNYVTESSAWVHDTSGQDDYWYQHINSHSQWYFKGSDSGDVNARVIGLKDEEDDVPEYMLELNNREFNENGTNTYLIYATASWSDTYIIGDENFYLRIKGKMRGRTRTDPYNPDTGEDGDGFYFGVMQGYYISIGNKTLDYTGSWVDTPADIEKFGMHQYFWAGGIEYGGAAQDTWLPIRTTVNNINYAHTRGLYSNFPITEEDCLISLRDDVKGYVTLSFFGIHGGMTTTPLTQEKYGMYAAYSQWLNMTYDIREMHIKDLEIDVVHKGDLDPHDDDIEYVSDRTSSWTDHIEDVDIYHDMSYEVGSPMDRAGLIKPVDGWSWWDEMKRERQLSYLGKLLCNTIVSNTSGSIKELELTVNKDSIFPNKTLTDETYHSGSIFMVTGYEISPTKRSAKYKLVEIKKDELTLSDLPDRRTRG